MRKLFFAAALLVSQLPAVARSASPGPASTVADLRRDDIERAPATATTRPFLYTVMTAERRIGIVYYDRSAVLDVPLENIDPERAKLHDCGSFTAFQAECSVAELLETQWFKADALGADIWFSRDLDGNPQCYSRDGENCLPTAGGDAARSLVLTLQPAIDALKDGNYLKSLFANNREIRLTTADGLWTPRIVLPFGVAEGSMFHLTVDSAWPVDVFRGSGTIPETATTGSSRRWLYSAGNWHSGDFNPNEIFNKLSARPIPCGPALFGDSYPWCRKLRGVERTFHTANVQDAIARKTAYMDTSFTQYADWAETNVDVTNDYPARLAAFDRQISTLTDARTAACIFAWIVPGAIACGMAGGALEELAEARRDLQLERTDRKNAARAAVQGKRAQAWHTLHASWAAGDRTHFAALLKAESKELAELEDLRRNYAKDAGQKHRAYLDAVAAYQHAVSPIGALEAAPLIGPEIRHVEDYVNTPSKQNLRRMLLGLAGPAGEAVEGVVELTTGDSALNAGEMKFLRDMLRDLGGNADFATTMEAVVADAINDLGDEAVESVRQAGLWTDKPGSAGELVQIDHASIVDLRARSRTSAFDPWTAGGEHARNFRNKFTPHLPGITGYMSDPSGYDPASLVNIELAAGGAAFEHAIESVFVHSFGKDYHRVVARNPAYADWDEAAVNTELYKVLADPAYAEERKAYWVTSAVIGRRPAGLLYDSDHAAIVLNSDLVRSDEDVSKFYFEELGHLLNWWRCDLFDVDPALCSVHGDAGARFRDAVLIDPLLHTGSYEALLAELPAHPEVDKVPARFGNGSPGWLEGWPDYYTLNDHIDVDGGFSFLMRLGLDVDSEYPGVSDEFDIELTIAAPKPAMKGDPWKKSVNGYCTSDAQADCNMPTMWVSIAFRDAIKLSIEKLPQVKSTAFANVGFDASPRIVRKHGGKLPFQPRSVDGAQWRAFTNRNIYFKKFTAGLETKLDFWKLGHSLKGASPSSVHKPEMSLKATPAEGSYVVEIAANDESDFERWLGADIATAVSGCVVGFAIGLVAEMDPVVGCHAASDAAEAAETAFQALDKEPTIFIEGDGSFTLPASLEYKYATSGKKLAPTAPDATSPNRFTGRVTYHHDPGTGVATLEEAPAAATSATRHSQIEGLKTRVGSGLAKLPARGLKPIGVFRFRLGIDYGEKVIKRGAHDLPSAIMQD